MHRCAVEHGVHRVDDEREHEAAADVVAEGGQPGLRPGQRLHRHHDAVRRGRVRGARGRHRADPATPRRRALGFDCRQGGDAPRVQEVVGGQAAQHEGAPRVGLLHRGRHPQADAARDHPSRVDRRREAPRRGRVRAGRQPRLAPRPADAARTSSTTTAGCRATWRRPRCSTSSSPGRSSRPPVRSPCSA